MRAFLAYFGVEEGMAWPFSHDTTFVGKRKSPDFAASSVSDRIAFAYSSSRNRTEHVPSREKLGIYRFHFRAVRSLQSGLSTNNREIRALFAYFGAERAEILCSSDYVAERE